MEHFTPWASLTGGVLIGLSISAMMLLCGRVTGISGIVAGAILPRPGETVWRSVFLFGLVSGGLVLAASKPDALSIELDRPMAAFALAGLMVGFGTRLGNGCTSGHGVCGITRGSGRSIAATLTFMGFGVLGVYLTQRVIGG